MMTVETVRDGSGHDKVTEKRMAELLGTTPKALQRKRERNAIPENVWSKIDGRIMYSIWRYDAWLESQWGSPKELGVPKKPSASGARRKKSASPKLLLSSENRIESQRNTLYILK